MKILHIINSLETGGAENMLVKLLRTKTFANDDIHVVTLLKRGPFALDIESDGHTVHSLGLSKNPFSILKLFVLFRLITRFRPDVMQSWLYQSDIVAGLFGFFFRIPVFWSLRQSNLSPQHNKLTTRMCISLCARLSVLLPERIISNSMKAKTIHLTKGYDRDKIIIIPNGFELNNYAPNPNERAKIRHTLGIEDNTPLVGMVGRYDSQKNHNGLFEAAFRVFELVPKVNFCLIGTEVTWSNQQLSKQIAEFKLPAKRIHLLGERADIPALMASFDVLALPSVGESFPNVVGEAMASGVCCVATDVGDCRKIIGNTGIVVTQGDMTQFAHALAHMLSLSGNKRLILGKLARVHISKHYDIEDIASRYRNVYVNHVL